MKRIACAVLFATLAVLCAASAVAKTPKETICEKLTRIRHDRDSLRLERNRLLWKSYLDYAGRTGWVDDVMKLKAVNIKQLCDTVPSLEEFCDAYDRTYEQWQETLRTDSLYEQIHNEYVALKNGNDRSAQRANTEQYNLMYARLSKSNPAYIPARDAKNQARRTRDMAVLEYLTGLYSRQGRELSPEGLFGFSVRDRLLKDYPVLADMDRRLQLLGKLYGELEEQLLREQYDLEKFSGNEKRGSRDVGEE